MQEIITAFGIDWKLIVIQIFNFALLLALLWYFLYKPVLSLIEARQQKITQGVKDAEKAAHELATAEAEKGVIVRSAHSDAEDIVKRAESYAEEKSVELMAEAQAKSDRAFADAEAKAAALLARARAESEDEITKVAILAAEKVLRNSQKS